MNRLLIGPLVGAALAEDLGRAGDITSDAVIPADAQAEAAFVARRPGTIAGLALAEAAFEQVDPAIRFEAMLQDGAEVSPGDVIARLAGPARGILTGERVALNFLGHLSGVADTPCSSTDNAIAGSVALTSSVHSSGDRPESITSAR